MLSLPTPKKLSPFFFSICQFKDIFIIPPSTFPILPTKIKDPWNHHNSYQNRRGLYNFSQTFWGLIKASFYVTVICSCCFWWIKIGLHYILNIKICMTCSFQKRKNWYWFESNISSENTKPPLYSSIAKNSSVAQDFHTAQETWLSFINRYPWSSFMFFNTG